MARLGTDTVWEKLLIPPFIHFFKLLYPFSWSNDPRRRLAAAAGGCVLLRTSVLRQAGGFAALRDAIIDDCALAVADQGAGRADLDRAEHGRHQPPALHPARGHLEHGGAHRVHPARILTGRCSSPVPPSWPLMFVVPLAAVARRRWQVQLRRYVRPGRAWPSCSLPPCGCWVCTRAGSCRLPVAAFAYLLMTWTSALRYWRGERSAWRGRRYLRACLGARQ